nr:hypothetical protein [uncultured Brachyspira sp.]
MSILFIKNASFIITCDSNDSVYNSSNLLIENGIITYIGKYRKKADKIIDALGCFMYLCLININHYLFQIFIINLPQVQNM